MTATGTILLLLVSTSTSQRLDACPPTPNCVSTQAEDPDQRMEPIPFRGTAQQARGVLLDLLAELPRVRLLEAEEHRLRTEFTTPLFRFKDDVTFLIDPEAGVIHFRSASRLGHHDLGKNRRRMEKLTRLFLRADAETRAGEVEQSK